MDNINHNRGFLKAVIIIVIALLFLQLFFGLDLIGILEAVISWIKGLYASFFNPHQFPVA